MAGGTTNPHGMFGAEYVNTTHAKVGDLGSKVCTWFGLSVSSSCFSSMFTNESGERTSSLSASPQHCRLDVCYQKGLWLIKSVFVRSDVKKTIQARFCLTSCDLCRFVTPTW